MKKSTLSLAVVAVLGSMFLAAVTADAAPLTADQRRALAAIRKDITQATGELRKDNLEEAEKLVAGAEAQLKKMVDVDMVDVSDSLFDSVAKIVANQRKNLDAEKLGGGKGKGKKNEISFSADVAPILNSRCVSCHNARRNSGGLSLENFADMERGGQAGPLLVVGNPGASLIAQKLIAQGNARMPRNGQPLTNEQVQIIAAWITAGAKFDGTDKATALADLAKGAAGKPSGPTIVIPKPEGNETVSFSRDIAPFMANLCVGCHNQNRMSGGLSLANFEELMRGGDSGRVVIPGDLDASRLWDLVGKQDPIKMPQGQARITRTNWNNLQTWIVEGAKYDGGDPKIPMRQLVPSDEDKAAEMLAKLTPDEFIAMREKQAEDMWKRVLPRSRATFVKSAEFFVIGNATEDRLKEVNEWAEEHAKSLRNLFGVRDNPIWKGRLVVFVFNERFGYTEFNQVIHSRDTDPQVTGHSVVTPSFSEAYVALEDVGDEGGASSGGLRINLTDHVTGAFLKRSGRRLPEWVVRGTGLAMAAGKAGNSNPYLTTLRQDAMDALTPLADQPAEVFVDGKFSPGEIAAVGYTLVDFMLKAGGGAGPKFGQFIDRLQQGEGTAAAVRGVYQASLDDLAKAYFQSFATTTAGKKK